MKRGKQVIILCLIVMVSTGIFLAYRYINEKSEPDASVYKSYQVESSQPLLFDGKVQEAQNQQVAYEESKGTITRINVQDGDTVSAGDILVTYSTYGNWKAVQEQKHQREQYEKLINTLNEEMNAETDENRIAVIEREIALYQKYIENIDLVIYTLNNTNSVVVPAEFDGIVKVDKLGRTDSSVPVVKVYSDERRVHISVTEYDVEKLMEGQMLSIAYVNQDKSISGVIQNISDIPEDDSETIANYDVTLDPEENMPIGYSLQVSLAQNMLYIPENTMIEENGDNYVYCYKNGKAIKTKIIVEKENTKLRVKDGLKEGDIILVNPNGVKDQMEVSVL